jgi:hypothetical protein
MIKAKIFVSSFHVKLAYGKAFCCPDTACIFAAPRKEATFSKEACRELEVMSRESGVLWGFEKLREMMSSFNSAGRFRPAAAERNDK